MGLRLIVFGVSLKASGLVIQDVFVDAECIAVADHSYGVEEAPGQFGSESTRRVSWSLS